MKKKLLIPLVIVIIIVVAFRVVLYPMLAVVTGISAKNLCSCVYVSGISQEEAKKTDLAFSLLWMATTEVDEENQVVHSNVLGMHPKKAVYREGRGCTLAYDTEIEAHNPKSNVVYSPEIWPQELVSGSPEMQATLQKAFDAPGKTELNTRGLVVIHKGQIIGEAYADGIDMNTPLLGWSMAKSVTGMLAGVLAKDGFWNLDDPMDIPTWQNDERKNITLKHLMRMSSGLEWEENYGAVSTATIMLYNSTDMGGYAQSLPKQFEPGTEWAYSSGTTNIIARKMADAFGDFKEYQRFPYERLFGPIGAKSFTFETDASGHFMGSTYGYASARDWGKLGLLMLQKGNWNGEQIIDSTWVEFCQTVAPAGDGEYGGQFWLNRGGKFQDYDDSAYWMSGFHSQQVSIHPDRDLVVVRLGVTYERGAFDFDGLMQGIYKAVD